MTELERLLHNLVSATVNVATAHGMQMTVTEKQRDEAVSDLAAYLEKKQK